jgi:hypothetical protein
VTLIIRRAGGAFNLRQAQVVQGTVMLFDGSLMFEGSISISSTILVDHLRLSAEGLHVASLGADPFEGSLYT